ncbi:MAG: hypothetical protein IKL08_01000 [Clostridia bacterium]|nr:hypothetical protein [Clostridia bacterium]
MNEQENNVVGQEPVQENIQNTNPIDNTENNEPGKYNLGPIEEPIAKKNTLPLVIALILAILVICGAVVGMFVKSWTEGEIKTPEEFKGETTGQTDNKKEEENKESVKDPYENFKNLTWSSTKSSEVTIKDNEVYYGEVKLDLDIEGTYKAVEEVKSISTSKVYLLTEEGAVWSFNVYFMVPGGEVDNVTRHLEDTKVLEMTYRDTNSIESIYFLTENGELLDINRIPYDKYDFVGTISSIGLSKIPYDSNNYLYHWNAKKNEYEQIVNKAKQKVAATKIIETGDVDGIFILTAKGYIFKYDGSSSTATQLMSNVKSIDFYEFKETHSLNMVITPKEGPKMVKYNVVSAYDIASGTTISLDSVKVLDPYAKYKNVVWADSHEEIGEDENYRQIYCEGEEGVFIVIGKSPRTVKNLSLISGEGKKAHVYRTINALIDAEVTEAYVITDDGKAYEVNMDNGVTTELTALSEYNIIDMACMGDRYKMMVFLTDAGELLTYNGNFYDYE